MSKDKQPKDHAEQGNEIKTVADLIQDEHNYRKHSDTNKARIKKSIDEAGLGRSVVIDADGVLVAGNGVQQVIDKDTPVRVVETDGTELVVVKRTDLHTDDPRRKTLALADNATADDVEWDFDAIAEDWTEEEMGEWGITAEEKVDKAKKQQADVPFTEILGEEHNYIVLFFDNTVDWLQAQSIFEIEPRKDFPTNRGGKDSKFNRIGVGRVINGAVALEKLLNHEDKH